MNFVELPQPVQASVVALVVALVGMLVRLIAMYVPWLGEFLEKYKEEWGTALGIALVNILQQYLPGGEWVDASVIGVELVVAVLVVLISKVAFAKAGVRGFRK